MAMSNFSKRRREGTRARVKALGDHKEFLKRITKSLYYGQLPSLPCLSLPVTEISAELFSEAQRGRSLKRLHLDGAAELARSACVSPCSLVLAILYLERLKACNPEYLAKVAPNQLFLVSLMVSNKFLQDDGEEDEVFCDEWAASGGIDISTLKHLEKNFLNAIDWRVYVSEQTFEAGLSWLERQVALKQANLRGFFTYSDLAASAGDLGVGELLKSFSSVCLAMTLGYITSLLAVVTSTLLISHSLLPSLHQHTSSPAPVHSNNDLITPLHPADSTHPQATNAPSNVTIDHPELEDIIWELKKSFTTQSEIDKVTCCSKWWKINEVHRQKKIDWLDRVLLSALRREPHESRWWRSSILNWLYQSSLITPLHKWLDKLDQWSNLLTFNILNYTHQSLHIRDECDYSMSRHGTFLNEDSKCQNRYLNLGKLNGFMVSVSDR